MASKKNAAPDLIAQETGTRLRKAREAQGWTQEQLALQTGWNKEKSAQEQPAAFSPSRIGNYEQGSRRMGYEEATLFGEVLGVHPAYFLGVVSEYEAGVLMAIAANQRSKVSVVAAKGRTPREPLHRRTGTNGSD